MLEVCLMRFNHGTRWKGEAGPSSRVAMRRCDLEPRLNAVSEWRGRHDTISQVNIT